MANLLGATITSLFLRIRIRPHTCERGRAIGLPGSAGSQFERFPSWISLAAVGVPRRASSAMACLVEIKRRYPISDLWLTDYRDRSSCLAATGLQKANFLRRLHDLGRLKAGRGVRDELYVPVDVLWLIGRVVRGGLASKGTDGRPCARADRGMSPSLPLVVRGRCYGCRWMANGLA